MNYLNRDIVIPACCAAIAAFTAPAASAEHAPWPAVGPFDSVFLQGGIGTDRIFDDALPRRLGASGTTWHGWIAQPEREDGLVVVAELCAAAGAPSCQGLALDHGRLLALGVPGLVAAAPVTAGDWHSFALVCAPGRARLFLDGDLAASTALPCPAPGRDLAIAPTASAAPGSLHFGGTLAGLSVEAAVWSDEAVRAWHAHRPDFSLVHFTDVGAGWPWQETTWRGLLVPQDPWTLPAAKALPDKPVATPVPPGRQPLQPIGPGRWRLDQWRLAEGPAVHAAPQALAQPGFDDGTWWAATVPGTVLTTLIDRGVYPDPDHGLNDMAIPERLARQDYWYRTAFTAPPGWAGRRLLLTLNGVNYAGEIWMNGMRAGAMRGAFVRGQFDVTALVHPGGGNALAVHVFPTPHPGIPHEESIAAGPGGNGGNMAIDGPGFMATEGWDWIPGIRDRDTGLWQSVEIEAHDAARILDPRVVTTLPLPRTDEARVLIEVPVSNTSAAAVDAEVDARFDDVRVSQAVRLPPGQTIVRFDPATLPALVVKSPRLWWPNGYGEAALHDMDLSVSIGGAISDTKHLRFGIRQITYELSLFDQAGHLRRVEIDPSAAAARHEQIVDERHAAIKQTPNGWAASLTRAGETSPAVHDEAEPHGMAPFLTIHVNGVPIAARGGSWGMDDSRKRSSRARLEPYFKLHRLANVNIIRNWVGQNTEEAFYDLADEYGLLVLNDFWDSTQDYQVEAQDPQLFLANARDTISHFRNHPSIALWFGRNEGVPQPILNEGLEAVTRALDGTRYYMASSNRINLWESGPYNYRSPDQYFTTLSKGFAVEVGTPSLSTLEALNASIPEPDRWPISDTLAFHDWHYGGNGDVASFMAEIGREFGAATDLADFERKAQMLNFVDYRAIFEGFNAHLWTENSGRMLWMTHPAWPSNHWQIYSADMDTHAAFYGVKAALEPLHVQMDLPDFGVSVINTTREAAPGMRVHAQIVSLDGRTLASSDMNVDAPANQATHLPSLPLKAILAREDIAIVALTLTGADGKVRSHNVYWQGRIPDSYRKLVALPAQPVSVAAAARHAQGEVHLAITLHNSGAAPALQAKLVLLDSAGARILPAYYSENYICLLPGETRQVDLSFPEPAKQDFTLALRGWNVKPSMIAVK